MVLIISHPVAIGLRETCQKKTYGTRDGPETFMSPPMLLTT